MVAPYPKHTTIVPTMRTCELVMMFAALISPATASRT
jgi:hypothetical protein